MNKRGTKYSDIQLYEEARWAQKEISKTLKRKKMFSTFMKAYWPLNLYSTNKVMDDFKGHAFTVDLNEYFISSKGFSPSNYKFFKYIFLIDKSLKRKNHGIYLPASRIKKICIEDYFSKYKENHKIIPNIMAYGFKYGIYSMIIGSIIIFCLMLYFLPLFYSLTIIICSLISLYNLQVK